jgi:hypothetical protein
MKPFRWWIPLVTTVIALGSGLAPYAAMNFAGKMPLWLRDHPWPMELVAIGATATTVAFALSAFRRGHARIVTTVAAAVGLFATVGFLLFLHWMTYVLPPPPEGLSIGTTAPDFTLPDEAGHPVTLSSLRGHPTLLVFYRGFW